MANRKTTAAVAITLLLFCAAPARAEDIVRSDTMGIAYPCDGVGHESELLTPGQDMVIHDMETTSLVYTTVGVAAPRSMDGILAVVRNGTNEFLTRSATFRYYVPAYSRPIPDSKLYHWERYAPVVRTDESLRVIGQCFPPGVWGYSVVYVGWTPRLAD